MTHVVPRAGLVFCCLSLLLIHAEPTLAEEENSGDAVLPEVTVRMVRPADVVIEHDRPTNTVRSAEIQRRQASSIFDVVKDTPGVSVDGGPRASGMKFNIRGFSDNEDVLFKIDGAVKGFEKYRFGSGVFIEPELLKAVDIQRGPAATSGSGALGGTISATTQNASDLLRPGQKLGAMIKAGYASNNDEALRMLALYGRLNDQWEWLGAVTDRQSSDIRLTDGVRLSASATQSRSSLLKLGWMPNDDLSFEFGHVAYASGPERAPYDATAGEPGSFGLVRRTIDDQTFNLRMSYTPRDSWIQLRGVLAREHTVLNDVALQSDNGVTYQPGAGPGDKTDDWRYEIWNAELFNDAQWAAGELKGVLTLGWQALRNQRTQVRTTQNPSWNSVTGAYPNGFYAAQPPGTKESAAWIVEHALNWRDWTLTTALRWDRYNLAATGGTLDLLNAAGQASEVTIKHTTPSLRLNWQPAVFERQWSFTISQADSFRPPLIDEAFTNGVYSRCLKSAGSTQFALYDKVLGIDMAPSSGICGGLYKPEVSTTREISAAWQPDAAILGARWQAKAGYFLINSRHTLDSLMAQDGQVIQPGTERRRGIELELQADGASWFGSFNHSRVTGAVSGGGLSLTQSYTGQLYDVPGPTSTLSLGAKGLFNRLELGVRLRDVGARRAIVPSTASACSKPGVPVAGLGNVGTQYGVRLVDLHASMRASAWATNDIMFRLSVDNLTDELYCLNDGFGGGVGTQAAGRNIKIQMTLSL